MYSTIYRLSSSSGVKFSLGLVIAISATVSLYVVNQAEIYEPVFITYDRTFLNLSTFAEFDFIIPNRRICEPTQQIESEKSRSLIIVHSSVGNFQQRQFIRETWGAERRRQTLKISFDLVFFLGKYRF